MKKAAAGKSDILRAIEKDPELRPMVEHYFLPKLSEREPFQAFITDFNARASALYPNWLSGCHAAKGAAASDVGCSWIACCIEGSDPTSLTASHTRRKQRRPISAPPTSRSSGRPAPPP